jgi:hypothetical protein
MKSFILALAVFVVLLVGYSAWPFFGLHSLATDIETRNATALSEQVDFIRLRRSLAEQIIAAYLQVTGRTKKLGAFEKALAIGIGTSVADPLIAQFVNPENLLVLLRGQTVPTEIGNVSFNLGKLPALSLGSAWAGWLSAEYGLGSFSIGVPVSVAPADQFRIRMQLLQWRWKLTGIDLPEYLRTHFAQELAKKFP